MLEQQPSKENSKVLLWYDEINRYEQHVTEETAAEFLIFQISSLNFLVHTITYNPSHTKGKPWNSIMKDAASTYSQVPKTSPLLGSPS